MEIEWYIFAMALFTALLAGITIGMERFPFNRLPISTSVKLQFIDKKKVYRTGYRDGEKDMKEWKCKLKRDRKIERMEKNMQLAQNQYCELYLHFQKYKFQKENE